MQEFHQLVNAILAIAMIYVIAMVLKYKKILKEEHSLTLARIVTDVFLPAIVFVSLAKQTLHPNQVEPALAMLGLELLFIALAWLLSSMLKFSRAQQGAIVFCSAFGSSTFLGYSIVLQVFPDNPEALSEAVLISEIGVGYPIFILGPILAAYFGSRKLKKSDWKASFCFFRSPVFFALIAGLLWSILKIPGEENIYIAPIFRLGSVLSAALTPLAILSVGLMFKKPGFRTMVIPLGIVILLKLILKPLLASQLASWFGFPELWKEILVLMAAMPSAVLGVVFLRRYGGDASLASALLLVTTLVSSITLLGVFWLFR
ncbi:MAG: AEC family transporter [Candidatus Sabulitectum sp.]|nr:AEC family transporter [Candidatus Sabulitectum sp.]